MQEAILALRHGGPVTIGGYTPLVIAAAETVSDNASILERGSARIVLTADRASAVLGRPVTEPVALRPAGGAIDIAMLRALADPTLPPVTTIFEVVPLPPGAAAGLALAKLARLLPALIVAPAPGHTGLPPAYVQGYAALSASLLVRVSEAVVPIEDMADCRIIAFRAPGTALGAYRHRLRPAGRGCGPVGAGSFRMLHRRFAREPALRLRGATAWRHPPHRQGRVPARCCIWRRKAAGIGLPNKLRAYALQDHGLDTDRCQPGARLRRG